MAVTVPAGVCVTDAEALSFIFFILITDTHTPAERNENGHENTEDGEVEENESKTEHEVDAVVR